MNAPLTGTLHSTLPARWLNARKLLCVRLDAMGDVLMSTPAIRALKQSGAQPHIALLTSPAGAAAARHVPEIDQVIVHRAGWMKHATPPTSADALALLESLRAEHFDAAVIFTVYSQSALPAAMLCWLADIPLRLAHARENPYHLLSDWVHETEPDLQIRHEVQRQLDLVAQIGARADHEHLSFRFTTAEHEQAMRTLHAGGLALDRPWIAVHPGASAASRRYAGARYNDALRLLSKAAPYQFVVTGSAAERDLVAEVGAEVPGALGFAGKFDLGELAAVIAGAKVLIANNTGPAHLAAALGTPVVDLYALTNPQHAPWKVLSRVLYHDVPCRFCYRSVCSSGDQACLNIAPSQVADAALELLRSNAEQVSVINTESTATQHSATN